MSKPEEEFWKRSVAKLQTILKEETCPWLPVSEKPRESGWYPVRVDYSRLGLAHRVTPFVRFKIRYFDGKEWDMVKVVTHYHPTRLDPFPNAEGGSDE